MTGRHAPSGGDLVALFILTVSLTMLALIGALVVWLVARGLVSGWLLLVLPGLAIVALEQLDGVLDILGGRS